MLLGFCPRPGWAPRAAEAPWVCGLPNGPLAWPKDSRPALQPFHPCGIFQVETRLKGPLWLRVLNTSCLWSHHADPQRSWAPGPSPLECWALLSGGQRSSQGRKQVPR